MPQTNPSKLDTRVGKVLVWYGNKRHQVMKDKITVEEHTKIFQEAKAQIHSLIKESLPEKKDLEKHIDNPCNLCPEGWNAAIEEMERNLNL